MAEVTLGIDLASKAANTGGCRIEWSSGRAVVRKLEVGLDDEAVRSWAKDVGAIGIDAPFGWPSEFVRAVGSHAAGSGWPPASWTEESRDKLRLRATDRRVREAFGLTPLSVSSDMIAVPAFRCAGLLALLDVTDRSGDGRVFEVYPAAALKQWGLPHRGYKHGNGASPRRQMLANLKAQAPWLSFAEGLEDRCVENDDAFDAFVAALVARAARKGLTLPPTEGEREAARVEGWIAVPEAGSLGALAAGHPGR